MEQEQQQSHTSVETSAAPTTPASSPTTPAASADNGLVMGILCYLGPLVIVPYLVAKDNAFVKFHIKQGVVLAVIELIIYVLGMSMLFWNFWGLLSLLNLACLVLSIIGIINVVQKKEVALPVIGGLADKVKI